MTAVAGPAALLACLASCFGGPVAPPPAVAVVPFDPYGGAIYVPAIVNGDSAWLMFDTGLSHSGLDRDWATSVGATPATDTSVTAVVAALRLGDLNLDSYRAALYSLGGLSEASGRQQLGLLGHDVLHRFVVEIDYPTRHVRLFDATSYRYRGPGAAVPFTPDADLPLLRATIKVRGRRAIPARLLLDTGASGLCLILTAPFVEQHGLTSVVPAIEAPIGTGLVGELHGTIVRLQELELGRLRVASPTTGLGGENKGFLGRTDIDGVIGNAVFEGSLLIVDYAEEPQRGCGHQGRGRAAADRRAGRGRGGPERRAEDAARGGSEAPTDAAARRGHDPGRAAAAAAAVTAGWWRTVEVVEVGGG